MKALKPTHVIFINGMVTHRDRIRAYMEAYPRSAASSAKANACRLLKNPLVKQHIDLYEEMEDDKRDRERVEQISNRFVDFMDSQEPLWDIACGYPVQKETAAGLLVMRYPSVGERLSAIFTAIGNEKRFIRQYPQYASWLDEETDDDGLDMLPPDADQKINENKKAAVRNILLPGKQRLSNYLQHVP